MHNKKHHKEQIKVYLWQGCSTNIYHEDIRIVHIIGYPIHVSHHTLFPTGHPKLVYSDYTTVINNDLKLSTLICNVNGL